MEHSITDNSQQHSDVAGLACNSSSFGVFQKTPSEAIGAATNKKGRGFGHDRVVRGLHRHLQSASP